ncbi:TPA: hypothetical protein N0F65_011004 [Lagenidium giganteum]|uniref:Uncharacterized protein n=1 Tax=Lagenidium giganteum TaxID=4803 RepID=A0AAV2ZAW0_9STRA|nr:TPA: hypothetical protein N0F65_011004 [Lagenidium giganteum]
MPVNAKKKMFQEQKVLVIGASNVGKTRLLLRMTGRQVQDDTATELSIDGDFVVRMANVDGVPMQFQLWDTAGQEKHGVSAIVNSFYRRASGAFLVYDVTNRATFDDVITWAQELERFHRDSTFALSVVANKADVPEHERAVSRAEGAAMAALLHANYSECSGLQNQGVVECFQTLAQTVYAQQKWNVEITDDLLHQAKSKVAAAPIPAPTALPAVDQAATDPKIGDDSSSTASAESSVASDSALTHRSKAVTRSSWMTQLMCRRCDTSKHGRFEGCRYHQRLEAFFLCVSLFVMLALLAPVFGFGAVESTMLASLGVSDTALAWLQTLASVCSVLLLTT